MDVAHSEPIATSCAICHLNFQKLRPTVSSGEIFFMGLWLANVSDVVYLQNNIAFKLQINP